MLVRRLGNVGLRYTWIRFSVVLLQGVLKSLWCPAFKTSSIPVCKRLTDACKVSCRRKFVISRRLQDLHTDVLLIHARRPEDVFKWL